MSLSPELQERIEKLIGGKIVSSTWPSGGYSIAERYVVHLDNGTSAFVKIGVDEATSQWLRDEYRVYSSLKADYIPKLVAWEDGERPILVLEDLSVGHWPPPWSQEQVERVFKMLEKVGSTTVPSDFPPLTREGEALNGWEKIAADPEGFLSLGLVSKEWFTEALPALLKAEQEAQLEGDSLVHTDVRSDNICFLGDRTLLVDWNWARRGNPKLDIVAWLPSLYVEGGAEPWSFGIHEPELISAIAGFYASHAYLPPNFEGAERIRELQLKLLKPLLIWTAKELNLPKPDLF